MINTWFTSDTHFGHKNILEYEKDARPFSTIEEMNEVMIDRWNSVVGKKDIVFHLGDFALGRSNIKIAERLNGKKKLVMGNHDTYPAAHYLTYFDKLYGVIFWNRCVLSHMPVHPNGLGSRWMLNVHGHLHSKNVREIYLIDTDGYKYDRHDKNYFNVSVEQHNLYPIHRDVIEERLKLIE